MGEDDADPERFLEWFCWRVASDGERFYPPDKTAAECMEAVAENYDDRPEEDRIEAAGWERGQHARAWTEAVEIFVDIQRRGFDPVACAEREIERAREDGLDLTDIDWEWLRNSRYDRDPPE